MYNKIVFVFDYILLSGIFIGYCDLIWNDGLIVLVFVIVKVKGLFVFVFGKYLCSKYGFVFRC